jgi:predicted ATP-grasp superfamily ATP-dependent carboligase
VAEKFSVWLAEHDERLPASVSVASPKPDLVKLCLDKVAMLNLVRQLGVSSAPHGVAHTLDELHHQAEQIGFPIIVRPFSHLNRLGHKKAVICRDRDDFMDAFSKWPNQQPGLLLQRYVSGERHDLYFVAVDGAVQCLLETRITRTDHPDGTGLSTEGQYVDVSNQLERDTRLLVEALGYTGIGFTQFIRDPRSGEITFLELNPRVAGSHRCAEAVGMPLTRSAIVLARGDETLDPVPHFSYPVGSYYAWLLGDLHGLKEAVRHREIGLTDGLRWVASALRSFMRARIHLVFTWRDPLPAIALVLRQTTRIIAAAARGSMLDENELTDNGSETSDSDLPANAPLADDPRMLIIGR